MLSETDNKNRDSVMQQLKIVTVFGIRFPSVLYLPEILHRTDFGFDIELQRSVDVLGHINKPGLLLTSTPGWK